MTVSVSENDGHFALHHPPPSPLSFKELKVKVFLQRTFNRYFLPDETSYGSSSLSGAERRKNTLSDIVSGCEQTENGRERNLKVSLSLMLASNN